MDAYLNHSTVCMMGPVKTKAHRAVMAVMRRAMVRPGRRLTRNALSLSGTTVDRTAHDVRPASTLVHFLGASIAPVPSNASMSGL